MRIYGDMNYYGELFKVEGSRIYYKYGCRLDNMTGILLIDLEEQSWINATFPEGIRAEDCHFRSFANKVLSQCSNGEIRTKVSREIG